MCMMNLDWRSISHMVIYMFQCYSFKLSLPTFSHRAQKSVLYTSVFFDVLHVGLLRGASSAPAKVLRKEAWHTQRRDQASGVSLEILEHLPPKPESAYFLLCAFTYTSDFMGGCPPLPLSEKRAYSSS